MRVLGNLSTRGFEVHLNIDLNSRGQVVTVLWQVNDETAAERSAVIALSTWEKVGGYEPPADVLKELVDRERYLLAVWEAHHV